MIRCTRSLLAASALAALWLSAAPAGAQMAHVPENDWRQGDRHDALVRNAQKTQFFFELRFGPYLPDVDSGAAKGTPFQDVFGLDCSNGNQGSVKPRFLFGFEADYMPLRIPYVGLFGLGLGWSFTQFSNNTKFTNMDGCSQESTTLTIMPMNASAVLRVDELMRRTGIPIVPYGKFGAGVAWWRSSNDLGTEKVCGTADAPAACASSTEMAVGHGTGLTPTLHFALGGMIALNFIEPQASARLDQTTGVHHAYVFGEYYNDKLNLSQNVMRVGAQSFVGGLAVDF